MNPIELSHDEYVAWLQTGKVLEGIYGDDRVPQNIRQFAYKIRGAMQEMLAFLIVKEEEEGDETQVV